MREQLTVWILQTGEPLQIDSRKQRPMRAINLADSLIMAGHKVIIWSAAFNHQEKRHRSRDFKRVVVSQQLEIRLIPSPGYQKNIGVGRLWDHAEFAFNLRKELNKEVILPNVAFIGYPPIESAAILTRWLRLRSIPTMLDVKDQWPVLFVNALPKFARLFGRVAFEPYFYLARRAMRDATGISAMSDSFLAWAIGFAKRQQTNVDLTVPLTVPRGQINSSELENARQWWNERNILADGKPRICFVGSHTSAFDFLPIYEAAKQYSTQDRLCEFIICGDGVLSTDWREQMSNLSNVLFPGWIDRAQHEVLAERSIASLAPYKNSEDFMISIPNKVIDSLSLGLPIVSPLKGEVANLINTYNIGLAYSVDKHKDLYSCIKQLIDRPDLQGKMSHNAYALYDEMFAFEKVYGGLVKHLEKLAYGSQYQIITHG